MPGCASVLVGLYGRSKKPPPRLGPRTITCCPAGSPSSCCLCGSANLSKSSKHALSQKNKRSTVLVRSVSAHCPIGSPSLLGLPVFNTCA